MSEVDVAAETFAIVAPKNTMLLAGVVLKFVPLMVIAVPTGPEVGVNDEIEGCAFAILCKKIKTRILIK